MKNTLQILVAIFAICTSISAQNQIELNINHMLGDQPFAFNVGAKNNMDHDFNVTRLQYYISGISVIHDGGMETLIEDVYVLVDANSSTNVKLGEKSVDQVEKIKFHVGVDQAANHLDPAFYPMDHPLAPKFPSMHWGWAAGYRFVAIEGNGGSKYNQLFQLHGVGDLNYYTTEVEVNATAENGLISIDLDADYTKALKDIEVNSGVIVHGDNMEAQKCMINFSTDVFSASGMVSSSADITDIVEYSIYPNPIDGGRATLSLELLDETSDYSIIMTNLEGKNVKVFANVKNGENLSFDGLQNGVYTMNLLQKSNLAAVRRVIIR